MTAVVDLHLACGRTVSFEVDTGRNEPACFALSVRKCGSSIFNRICKALTHHNRHRFIDVGNRFFVSNVTTKEYCRDPELQKLIVGGNVYGGFRTMPLSLRGNELFEDGPKLLMIRDPRDALVSEYFSVAYSHPLPPAEPDGQGTRQLMEVRRANAMRTEIDEYVRNHAKNMARTMLQYRQLVYSDRITVFRYEDYIFEKTALMRLIVERFGFKVDDERIERIMQWADKRPEHEDKFSFVRKVTPGDHLEKLRPETISAINETLQPAMELFGYKA